MARHGAFLRGVNLGAHRRASSADLRAAFEGLGFEDVGTFRTSGNVAFAAGREAASKLKGRIEAGLERALGFDVTVFLRSERELRAIAAGRPIPAKRVAASGGKLQVSLLATKPAQRARREVLALATEEDALALGDRELYWLPSGGLMESELDLAAIEKLLGPTTRRTMGTLELMVEKYFPG